MSEGFRFCAPTEVLFGRGARSEIPSRVRGRVCGVLSSPTVLDKDEVRAVLETCANRGHGVEVLGTVSPNPRLSEIEAAYSEAIGSGTDTILAVGGGSVLDAAKLLRVAVVHQAEPRSVLDDLPAVVSGPSERSCRLVASPTTAGTGAEVSRGAIITDDSTGTKRAARGAELIPDVAIIDPELALSLPARRTAETGFDVIAHAIETYLSRAASPVTDIFAEAALDAAPDALKRAVRDPADVDARETLALHAWLMGYNLAHASTCLPHRMQYPIGSLTDTSHQVGLAALYPAWLDRVEEAAPTRARRCVAALGRRPDGPGAPDVGVREFLAEIGLTMGLKDLGVDRSDLPALAGSVTGRTDLDPIEPTSADILEIFTRSFGG